MRKKPLILVAFLVLLYIAPMIFILSYGSVAIPAEQNMTKNFVISSDWYDEDWHYRKNVIMYSGLGGLDAPYTVKVVVSYDSDMQADFDDIRFTDDDNVTLLDYWLETKIDSTSATFWVNVTDSQEWGTYFMIQMYYGNNAVSTTSDGEAVFLFFDDFENDNLNRWTLAESNWATQGGVVRMGSFAAYGDASAADRALSQTLADPIDYDVMVHCWTRVTNIAGIMYNVYGVESNADTVCLAATNTNDVGTYDGGWLYYVENAISVNTWYRYEVAIDFTDTELQFWLDRVAKTTRPLKDSTSDAVVDIEQFQSVTSTTAGQDQYLDDFYIRKWIQNGPEVNSWGEEENNFRWVDAGTAIIMFEVPIFTGSLDALLIFLGLIMIPASTLYFVKGGKEDMSSDKLFYCLIVFVMGWALFLGGIYG